MTLFTLLLLLLLFSKIFLFIFLFFFKTHIHTHTQNLLIWLDNQKRKFADYSYSEKKNNRSFHLGKKHKNYQIIQSIMETTKNVSTPLTVRTFFFAYIENNYWKEHKRAFLENFLFIFHFQSNEKTKNNWPDESFHL